MISTLRAAVAVWRECDASVAPRATVDDVTQGRHYPPARAYLARKEAEGKSRKEALRCLKRHLARTVYRTLTAPTKEKMKTPNQAALTPALT